MVTASSSWSKGTREVNRVMVGIMDGEIVETAIPELQNAFNLLSVGDTGYALFLESVAALPETVDAVGFPPIRYINPTPDDLLRFNVTNLVLRIQAAYGLAPHHDVSISGSTEPAAVGDKDGIPVVPFSDSLAIIALVTNEGNEPEVDVAVSLDVVDVDTGDVVSKSETIAELDVGTSTTVIFDAIEIEPGGLYQAVLTARINGDIDTTNNEWTMTFIWNADS
jgi:hypothetical protein